MNSRLATFQILTVIFFIVSVISITRCNRANREQNKLLKQVQLNETELTKTRDQLGREIATFTAYQLTKEQAAKINDSTVQSLRRTVGYFRRLASHTAVESITTDTVYMPADDSTVSVHDTVRVAKTFRWNDEWLTVSGMVLQDTAMLAYALRNSISVDYFWKRPHWWKKPELYGSVIQSNPHTTTDRVVQFTVIAPPPAWYQKWWVNMAVGAAIGSATTYMLAK